MIVRFSRRNNGFGYRKIPDPIAPLYEVLKAYWKCLVSNRGDMVREEYAC
jgi:hypothetical protein